MKVKKPRAISLEYSDSGSDWLSSGDEWTPDTHSTDLETGHGFGRLSKLKNPKAQLVCPQKEICKGVVMKVTPTEEDCYVCNISVIDGCLKHPIEWVENNPITVCDAAKDHEVYFQRRKCVCGSPYYLHASRTAPPDWVRVWKSGIHGAGFGVWANKNIKCGTTFGPYGGVVVNLDEMEDDEFTRRSRGGYAWLVRNNLGGVKSHLVDARNPLRSNWLRFVNCARCDEEQNLVTIQYRGKIYYRACQDIANGSELLTYYGIEVSSFLTG
ncbi:Histone-lysine N-methyltransferase PRDM9 [Paragonimus heterotremus]|uniref:Histone-lysine N-methyltransferase PRDM9 n=1 Tax=Paragonimus heterotremus TaxID=100268 RepID=A0A8J4X0A3_9TREM|nr:Histone-lysine N-methyltransferase PRDM9 [Paragonimus heterotremus]